MSQTIVCDGNCEPAAIFPSEYEKQVDWIIVARATVAVMPSTCLHFCPTCWQRLRIILDELAQHQRLEIMPDIKFKPYRKTDI